MKRATIICFSSFKGGAGKTTDSVATSAELGRRGFRTTLVDLDVQANATINVSLAESAEMAMPIDIRDLSEAVSNAPKGLAAQIQRIAEASDYVVIDTPGNMESYGTQMALMLADIAVVPVQPLPYDLASTRKTMQVLERVQALNPKLICLVVKNRPERTVISRNVDAMLDDLGLPVMRVVIARSVALVEMGATGHPLWKLGRGAQKANENIRDFVDELLARSNGAVETTA